MAECCTSPRTRQQPEHAVLRRFILVLLAGLLMPTPVGAQFKLRAVSGFVTDMRNNPLPNVAVQLENTRDLAVRSYITGKDGRYYFNDISDDVDFTLRAKYRKWWSKPKTLSKFDSSTHSEVDLVIPID